MMQFGWLRLRTTFAMGMMITNYWVMFCYGIKRYHYVKFIGIRELSKQITVDCFNDTFTKDTGNLTKNVPSLDDIDNKGTVFTFWSLNYSSSSPRNSEISPISEITITTAPTTAIVHTALKEVQLEVWRYNREARGY